MALDPTFNAYAAAVSAASGIVAAGMHWTTVASSHAPPPPRRQLAAQLVRTAVVGLATCEVLRRLPVQLDLVPVLVIAAVVGSTLGPRGLWWLLLSALSLLKRAVPLLSSIPDPPAPDPPEPPPPKEAKDA
ncbi:hypothetical protein DAERI_060094 [Deinococcus aerius]|uniref:Uncharacterized protein n=1 Tax=Deinococcus aerius TaxID=200253 RepID=A0A2I9CV86_9DEIO|nr:hypothetical protein [Deinococcus aerius]GBF05834.1 hypothetical protein DAERI_060094 [Deinococcus aerius]